MDTNRSGENRLDSSNLPTLKVGTAYKIKCFRNGEVVWTEDTTNKVVNTGLEYILGTAFGDVEQVDMYCGLCSRAGVLPEDTMSEHQFDEFIGTSNVERSLAVFESGGVVNNKAVYIATDVQSFVFTEGGLRGIFLTDNKMVGSNTGLLFGVAPFSEEKVVIPGDSLLVEITISAEG
jgi:hypothetical protein